MIYANFGGGFVKKNEFEQDETRDKRMKERTRAGRKIEREQEEKENASRKKREIKGRKKEREQKKKNAR